MNIHSASEGTFERIAYPVAAERQHAEKANRFGGIGSPSLDRFCYVQPVKKNHIGIGLVAGAALGAVFGAVFGSVGLGILIGAGIGLVLGMLFRAASQKRKGN